MPRSALHQHSRPLTGTRSHSRDDAAKGLILGQEAEMREQILPSVVLAAAERSIGAESSELFEEGVMLRMANQHVWLTP